MNGSISGYVVSDCSEQPMGDVSVVVISGPNSSPDIAALTNPFGYFVLDNLREGTWRLRAMAPNGSQSDMTVDVFEHAVTAVKFLLPQNS